jgi:glucose-6-phosphate isomerase
LPLAIIGVDIQKLLNGCKIVHESFFNKGEYYDLIINKARFLVENKSRFPMNIIFSYSSVFRDFNRWFVQLWAESLGKKNINGTRQGLTPISLIGPDDQHSFLQLIMDGPRDKTVTIFKIDNLKDESLIPDQEKFSCFDLDYLNNKSFNELINLQADSTYEAILQEKDIPCDKITITEIDEINIAKLMYRFLLLTSSVGSFMQINAYDQPGVEMGKEILKNKFSN